ncbi:hypothetical protein [Actinomadura kijaniata]|uniref:hypothetical protein n=1 Tax=Actinomadura kijaniata TaxID=46161 RepID=UPI000830FB2A|nr:hypothetical protein [Actinomadura kijaniata]
MSAQVITEAEVALGHLESLTDELRARGWAVEIAAFGDRWPSATVANPELTGLNETVIAVLDHTDRSWSFFYGWGERIAPCAEVHRAATALARVLAVRRD